MLPTRCGFLQDTALFFWPTGLPTNRAKLGKLRALGMGLAWAGSIGGPLPKTPAIVLLQTTAKREVVPSLRLLFDLRCFCVSTLA